MPTVDTAEFVKRAISKHGERYDYSKSVYSSWNAKVIIGCKRHGDFLQEGRVHLRGAGCKRCGKTKTGEQFIEQAEKIHGTMYIYDQVDYNGCNSKVRIGCTRCNTTFEQAPSGHLSGSGCPSCVTKKSPWTTEEFVARAREAHGDRYDYKESVYINSTEMIKIICQKHGVFLQMPVSHVQGFGCYACGNEEKGVAKRAAHAAEFVAKAVRIHGAAFDYSLVDYQYALVHVKIKCVACSTVFEQTPNHHLSGDGCPACAMAGTSKIQFEWLDFIAFRTSQPVQTAMDEPGEHKIGSYRLDGFIAATNQAFEFEGCYFHGCPVCFRKRDELNELCGRTYRDLLHRTIVRAQNIRAQGYTVEVMWEHTWKNLRRVVLRAQRTFRQRKTQPLPPLSRKRPAESFENDEDEMYAKRTR
jgi:predicted  nucleic acid-binding Zn-ribbon protein